EYIQKNKERIFKIFLNDDWKSGEAVKFKLDVLRNIDFNKKNHKFYFRKNRNANIKNYAITPIDEDNSKEFVKIQEREKQFFNKEIKYEDIDWGKYIEHMGDYPVLIMYVEERVPNTSGEGYWIFDSDIREGEIEYTPEKVKALKELYKEFEKYYNKDTFTFAIYDL
ncbi:hypothetical protein, partial [Oceanivirga salmonicida]